MARNDGALGSEIREMLTLRNAALRCTRDLLIVGKNRDNLISYEAIARESYNDYAKEFILVYYGATTSIRIFV